MKFLKVLLATLLALSFSSTYAQEFEPRDQDGYDYNEELNEKDFDALREYLNTKRTINLEEKDTNLTISGDIRFEWRHLCEYGKRDYVLGPDNTIVPAPIPGPGQPPRIFTDLRGGKAFQPIGKCPVRISRNDIDIEFNLRFDYVSDRTWGVAHVQYDNSAGTWSGKYGCCDINKKTHDGGWFGSGECDDLCLRKAYFGVNLLTDDCTRADIEIGRRNLYNIFDSHVQYLSRFDGILFKYKDSWTDVADWYWNTAAFVVDERTNQFAWITELGFLDILDSGFDVKYSFIDWRKNGSNRCFIRNPKSFKYLNSQVTVYYNFESELFCNKKAQLYAAIVTNHNAAGNKNIAWYAGYQLGKVVREGDYALYLEYQYVEPNSIPDNDVSGIGHGNVLGQSYLFEGTGNVNYKGWHLEALYAITDNLNIDTQLEWSHSIYLWPSEKYGGPHDYSKFEVEAIYAF